MKLPDFKLERYFAKYEFKAPYLLSCSDCESFTIKDILDLEEAGAGVSFEKLWLGYTESQGSPGLRQYIAKMYHRAGVDNVLVTSGAEEAIFIFMNTVLNKGDHVIVQYPCYQSLSEVARFRGCEVTEWKLKEQDAWVLDLDWLAKNIKHNTKAIIINSPHNPTGYLITQDELEYIVELARSRGILIFSDEVYRFLEHRSSDRSEAACDIYENAVSLGVMSKTYGLAGLRIGWVVTRNTDIYNQMAAFKDYTSICNSAPSEFLAALALKHQDELVERNLGIIRDNLAVLDDFFARYKELFSWPKPKAGAIAFPHIKWDEDVENFCVDLVNSKGVLLLPGNYYDFGNKSFRIAFGRKNMPECVLKLEEYVREKLF